MNDDPRFAAPVKANDEVAGRSFASILGVILLLALVLRIALLIYADRNPARFDYPDSRRYIQVARHIAAGNGPIDSEFVRSGTDPLYPAMLSVGILSGLDDNAAILRFGRIVNTLCALGSIALLSLIGRRLISERAGLIAALMLAGDPIILFFNGLVLTESLYMLLLLAAVYCTIRVDRTRPRTWAILAGFAVGLGAITRSTSLLLILAFIPFIFWFAQSHPRTRWRITMVFVVGSLACLAPIVARNYSLFGHIVPVRTGGGASLLEAFGPWADGGPGMDRIEYPPIPTNADEYTGDRVCREAAIDWIQNSPAASLRLAWAKWSRTWSITINAPGYDSFLYRLIGWLTVAPLYLFALVGVYLLRKKPMVIALCLLPAAYFSCVHMVFVGSVRYRLPAMPFLFLLAGATIDHLWRAARAMAARG